MAERIEKAEIISFIPGKESEVISVLEPTLVKVYVYNEGTGEHAIITVSYPYEQEGPGDITVSVERKRSEYEVVDVFSRG